ncbi:MAG: sulfatase [Candidatus Binatia bacterium]
MIDFVKRVTAGVLGGFVGGALVGLAEAAVISLVSGPSEYWVFVFGVISYGCLGAAMGAGFGFAVSIVRIVGTEPAVMGAACGLVVAALGLVVARFRVIRDVFGESLPIASAAGIGVHLALLVGAGLAFVTFRALLSGAAARRGVVGAGLRWAGTIVAVALVAAVGLNVIAGGGEDAGAEGAATATGPNALLVIVDTLRADHTGPYGAKDVSTPALDALAADGVVFENTFAQSSWTRPSVATILTSLYASSHSVMHKTDLLPEEVTTVAEAMQEAGYRTSGFVTNINLSPSFNFEQGFETYRYLAPDFFFGATDSGSKLSLYSGMRLIRERFLSRNKYAYHYYQDGETVNDTSLPWLDDNAEEPFFTLVHYMDPHDPYFEIPYNGKAVARVNTPHPAGDRAGELRELYVDNIEYVDGFLGGVFGRLKKLGLYDDMLIVVTADHGEEFYEHEGWWHGTTLYDEQVHVPLIVKLPNNARRGQRVRDLARLVDVMPTILTAAGVGLPTQVQGRDLFGTGGAPDAVYAEEDHEGNVLESIRTADWKLVVANEGNPRGLEMMELYYLGDDPGETRNLASSRTERVAELRGRMTAMADTAAANAVSGVSGDISSDDAERLKALGYME